MSSETLIALAIGALVIVGVVFEFLETRRVKPAAPYKPGFLVDREGVAYPTERRVVLRGRG